MREKLTRGGPTKSKGITEEDRIQSKAQQIHSKTPELHVETWGKSREKKKTQSPKGDEDRRDGKVTFLDTGRKKNWVEEEKIPDPKKGEGEVRQGLGIFGKIVPLPKKTREKRGEKNPTATWETLENEREKKTRDSITGGKRFGNTPLGGGGQGSSQPTEGGKIIGSTVTRSR